MTFKCHIVYVQNDEHNLRYKIFHGKLNINSMSIKKGNVEYIITQTDHEHRHQKCDFHWSTLPFLEFSCICKIIYLSNSYNNTRCMKCSVDLSSQMYALTIMQKMQKLITDLNILLLIGVGGAKVICIVYIFTCALL